MTLNVGVLGCADIAKRRVIPALLETAGLKLKAVASRTKSKAESFSKAYNCAPVDCYDRLLENKNIDIVYIPLPIALHEHWCMKALNAGKHVFLEKASTTNLESAQIIVHTARKNKRLVVENFAFQYHSQLNFVREKIQSGTIGEIKCLKSSFAFPPFSDSNNIRYNKELGGGALLDAGTYTLKCARLFLGDELHVRGAVLYPLSNNDVELLGGALLDNNSGTIAQIAFGFNHYYQCNYEVWGTKGKITADRAFTAGPTLSPSIHVEVGGNFKTFNLPLDNQFINILQVFRDAVLKGEFESFYQDLLMQAKLIDEVRTYAQKQ